MVLSWVTAIGQGFDICSSPLSDELNKDLHVEPTSNFLALDPPSGAGLKRPVPHNLSPAIKPIPCREGLA